MSLLLLSTSLYSLVDRSCTRSPNLSFFFFNDTATTEIYTLSLHDALPICSGSNVLTYASTFARSPLLNASSHARSEEHTSELQSRLHLVCRLLLEKKKKTAPSTITNTRYRRFNGAISPTCSSARASRRDPA